MPGRKIIHVDMDAFFASVEQRDNPELRGKPVAVGGNPNGRGVVAAASYEARKFGVHSAMPSARAKRACPNLIFVRHRFDVYKAVSQQIREIFRSVTPLVEPLSLDEAYLDVTENSLGMPYARDVAKWIKARITEETQLTASAGVAPNKFLAKVASDLRKPNGLVIIPPDRVEAFITPLKVEKIWGVGPATAKRLHALGIRTGGQLRTAEPAMLERALGKHGRFLHRLAQGDDTREVTPNRIAKSRGAEVTLSQDVTDLGAMDDLIDGHAERISASLQKAGYGGRTVTLKVRYDDFETITRARSLAQPTTSRTLIAATARELLRTKTDAGDRPVRLIGVSVSGFDNDHGGPEQLWLDLPLP